jgi:nucleoside-diphosphate-sugar epimerase
MKRRLLVIGSTAALGQALMMRLGANPEDFIVYAPTRSHDSSSLDLRYHDQIKNAIQRTCPDLIINIAATFSNNFDEAFSVNVNASRLILETVKDIGLSTRVVLIGSAAEYGIVSAQDNPIKEDRVLRPVSIYGMSKAWQTELALMYASSGVNVVVARVFNLSGPGLSDRLFIGRLHKQISEILGGSRQCIEVGSLSSIRDYISLDDAVTQLLVIANYGIAGEVYHVASGQPTTMREVLVCELNRFGLSDSIVEEKAELSNRSGHDVPIIYANISKTANLIKHSMSSCPS